MSKVWYSFILKSININMLWNRNWVYKLQASHCIINKMNKILYNIIINKNNYFRFTEN